MKTIECAQGSTEWLIARLGVITASEVDALVTPEFAARKGDGVKTYLYSKIHERVMGLTGMTPGTFSMDQGKLFEDEVVPFLEFEYGWEIKRVGFCLSDDKKVGCSPDGLIGDDVGLEIKCPEPQTHVRYLFEGVVPKQYLPQVHFSLWVTGRKKWVFVSYRRYLPPLVVVVERDEAKMTAISTAVASFLKDLDEGEAKLRSLLQPKPPTT